MTIYTKLTLSREVYERFHANFRPFSGNFPFTLSSCTKGSLQFFVWFTKFLRNSLFSSHLAKLEGSLLVKLIQHSVVKKLLISQFIPQGQVVKADMSKLDGYVNSSALKIYVCNL